jgi:small subunit ribosomal protein S6
MTMPGYELVFIAKPTMEQEALAALVEKVTKYVTDLEGQVVHVDSWGKRRLAFPIKKQFEGFYYVAEIELPATSVRSLERNIRLVEDIIRYLVVRKDEA